MVGMGGAAGGAGLGLEGVEFSQVINSEGIHKEIVAGTTVRQSVVRSSVLPTIDGGVKVLKPIFGGVRQSSAGMGAGAEFGIASGEGAGAGAGLGAEFTSGMTSSQIGATTSTTSTNGLIDLGTTVHNTIDLGVVNTGATTINTGAQGSSAISFGENLGSTNLGLTTEATGAEFQATSSQMGLGSSGLAFTTSQMGTTQIQGADSNGLVMGLGGEGDNAVDVGYTTNNNANIGLSGFGATTSSTEYGTAGTTTTTTTKTVQYTTSTGPTIVGSSNVLNPIVNTTVKEPIITGSNIDFQTNNSTL